MPATADHVAGSGADRARRALARVAVLLSGRHAVAAAVLGVAGAGLVGCGTGLPAAAPPPATAGGAPPAADSTGSAAATTYELNSLYYSRTAKLTPPLDPEVFIASAGSPAGTGPEGIAHAAGVTPAPVTAAATTPLAAGDGTPLKIPLGDWDKATGLIRLSCVHGHQQAASRLAGLIPGGTYSIFLEVTDPRGSRHLTPWGDAAGTTNNFTATADGSATPTTTMPGCSPRPGAHATVIWHSDGQPHGHAPGLLGVNAHTSLIATLQPGP